MEKSDIQMLSLLARQYNTIQKASTEVINLSAILNLPKGTEHFLSDIHGESEAFLHVLKNGSGSVRRKVEEVFSGTLMEEDKRHLASLIFYPEQRVPLMLKGVVDKDEFFKITLFRLIKICRIVTSKYTRSKVRKALPDAYAYIIEELLHEQESVLNKQDYYNSIIESIVSTGRAHSFVVAICHLIYKMTVDHLHIIGDIYDRGPGAHIIMDALIDYHTVDIQWGNHDILWMGAASGSAACIANVLRISLRYGNLATLEDAYGISLLPLARLAIEIYGDDPCKNFFPKNTSDIDMDYNEEQMIARMHKAITIIQLKLEGQIIERRDHFQMANRIILKSLNLEKEIALVDGKEYKINDSNFPTFDKNTPLKLTDKEQEIIEKLTNSFKSSTNLRKHVKFLYEKGSMYLIHNNNLLYHGCISMKEDGTFDGFEVDGKSFSGKSFMDRVERLARQGYFAAENDKAKLYGMDAIWYLWSGRQSPLYGKDKMATFERYFITDSTTHKENKNPYYIFRDNDDTARKILFEFGLNPESSHIINGHVPVAVKKGENPVKGEGRLIVIDGGFSKAYQPHTGIAGYTLVSNSHGMYLVSHKGFSSTRLAVEEEQDILTDDILLESAVDRLKVKDTDKGKKIQKHINQLNQLLKAYQSGDIKEGEEAY
ncbi:MAG: fructose-1,6-bisphosphatase [Spirochaetaceae bacterium]|jgi:fructose-1,6-bisphosphatase-3|nr:fructose-1,6-bisphosphatase [Spirochaetaceae bacterium]